MLGVAYFGSAQQNEFDDYLLDSISAVVVGGTSLFGGRGGIGNTILGLFVLGVLEQRPRPHRHRQLPQDPDPRPDPAAGADHQRLRAEAAAAGGMTGIGEAEIAAYQRDGAVCLRGVFKDWVDVIAAGIERNMREPGPYAVGERAARASPAASSTTTATGSASRNSASACWNSPAAEIAAAAMRSTHRPVLPRPCAGQGAGHAEADALAPGHPLLLRRRQPDRQLLDPDRSR